VEEAEAEVDEEVVGVVEVGNFMESLYIHTYIHLLHIYKPAKYRDTVKTDMVHLYISIGRGNYRGREGSDRGRNRNNNNNRNRNNNYNNQPRNNTYNNTNNDS
jgi:hypothetical protein